MLRGDGSLFLDLSAVWWTVGSLGLIFLLFGQTLHSKPITSGWLTLPAMTPCTSFQSQSLWCYSVGSGGVIPDLQQCK